MHSKDTDRFTQFPARPKNQSQNIHIKKNVQNHIAEPGWCRQHKLLLMVMDTTVCISPTHLLYWAVDAFSRTAAAETRCSHHHCHCPLLELPYLFEMSLTTDIFFSKCWNLSGASDNTSWNIYLNARKTSLKRQRRIFSRFHHLLVPSILITNSNFVASQKNSCFLAWGTSFLASLR